MKLVDWAARWNPVPDARSCRVWLPAQQGPAAAQAAAGRGGPRSTTISPTHQQAHDLPVWLPRLLAEQDVRPGDRVTVDLAGLLSVHLTGLELLMTVLWRRVGTQGEVRLTGGSTGVRAQLDSLDLTPATCRAAVYGPPPALRGTPEPVPALLPEAVGSTPSAPLVPQQRRLQDPLRERTAAGTRGSRSAGPST